MVSVHLWKDMTGGVGGHDGPKNKPAVRYKASSRGHNENGEEERVVFIPVHLDVCIGHISTASRRL